jgi:hypothetical protein
LISCIATSDEIRFFMPENRELDPQREALTEQAKVPPSLLKHSYAG